MEKDLLANKNCIHALFAASLNSATRMHANPIAVNETSPQAAINVPNTMTKIDRNTFVLNLSNPMLVNMANNTTGPTALHICKKLNER